MSLGPPRPRGGGGGGGGKAGLGCGTWGQARVGGWELVPETLPPEGARAQSASSFSSVANPGSLVRKYPPKRVGAEECLRTVFPTGLLVP